MSLATDIKFILKAQNDSLELAKFTVKGLFNLYETMLHYIKEKEGLQGVTSSDKYSPQARYIFDDLDKIDRIHQAIIELDKINKKEERDSAKQKETTETDE